MGFKSDIEIAQECEMLPIRVASACVIQLASTQLIGGRQTAQAATANRTLTVTLSAKRGRILDEIGRASCRERV